MTATTQDLAAEALGFFETRKRSNGDQYIAMTDDRPDWLQELVREAHSGMLPDDRAFELVRSALDCLSEADDPEDAAHEWADAEVDVYNSDRLAWLASNSCRIAYVDDARGEFGADADRSIIEDIGLGQYMEAREVFASVLNSLEAQTANV